MIRKQTRPKIVDMPRRAPSLQLSSRPLGVTPRPTSLRQPRQRPAPESKPITQQPRQRPTPTTAAKSEPDVMPRRVNISSCAQDQSAILRAILSGKTKDPEAEKNYMFEIPVIVTPRDIHRPSFKTAFPGFKLHRLWKLKPGRYCLLGWDKHARELLLRQRNFVFKTQLPNGVMAPPDEKTTTYLDIGGQEAGQRSRRVTVKWVSV